MIENKISEESIKCLVNGFYAKIRKDSELGPIFAKAIEDEDWPSHIEQMCNFWSAIMLGTRRYVGSPVQKHMMLPFFDSVLFERWLRIFKETVYELHSEEIANQYMLKAANIAKNLKQKIYVE